MARTKIRQYYLLHILMRSGISVITAMYVTFLLSKGLNLLEANLVNMVFFVTLFLCEIPTGAFADVFGRKASFLISSAMFALSMLVYGYSETFWGFVVAEVLAAVAHTFLSGAFDAWLVDSLKHHGHKGELAPIFARASQLGHGTGLVAALIGAMLADISMNLPWFAGAVAFCLAGLLGQLIMKEEYFVREPFSFSSGWIALKNTVRVSIDYGYRNKNLRFVMILTVTLAFAVMAPNMQWQPYFGQWLPNQTSMGFLWTAMALSLMLGASLAPKLVQLVVSERRALLLCHAGTGLGIMAAVTFGLFSSAVILFLAHEVARGAFGPIKSAYLHTNIPSKERATIVSFESLAHHIGGAVGLGVSGVLAQYGSIPLAWCVAGLSLLLVASLLWRNGK